MVALRAEVQHSAAEEAELHADLHEQREVAEAERLEAGDVAAEIVVAAVLAGVALLGEPLPHAVADGGVRAVQEGLQVGGGGGHGTDGYPNRGRYAPCPRSPATAKTT